MNLKRHKVWHFKTAAGTKLLPGVSPEDWHGDCPQWVKEVRKSRPDLIVSVGVVVGPRDDCTACTLNSHEAASWKLGARVPWTPSTSPA